MKKPYFSTLFSLCLLSASLYAQLPSLNWMTNIGSSDIDEGYSIAIDDSSNVYSLGLFSGMVDFDPSAGNFILTSNGVGNSDIFIAKYNSLGEFKWAKRIGNSSENEIGRSISLDDDNNICIVGDFEGMVDFDPGPGLEIFNMTSIGGADIFVLKLNNSGELLWAKQMGGTGDDYGYSIDVNTIGNVSTTGYFNRTADFDPDPLQTAELITTGANTEDIFVSTLDASGDFVWAKKMGGTTDDRGVSLTVDVDGNIYTTGFFTSTADFNPDPNVTFPYSSFSGAGDCFISKLDASGNFVDAWRLGFTPGHVESKSITSDIEGNIYLTGNFSGTVDFDPGPGDEQQDLLAGWGSPNGSIFVLKWNPDGVHRFANNLGDGFKGTEGNSIFVGDDGRIYVTGSYWGDPFGAGNSKGETDIFIMSLDTAGNRLWVIPSYGDESEDIGSSIAVDSNGSIFTTGLFNGLIDFDPTGGTFNVNSNGVNDAYVLKLCQIEIPTIDGPSILCQGDSIVLSSSASYSYLWSNGDTTRSIVVSAAGNYSVTITNSSGCSAKSVTKSVLPKALPNVTANATDESVCLGSNATLTGGGAITYIWTNGITNGVSFSPSETAIYTVIGTDANGCHNSDSIEITVNPLPIVFASASDTSVCSGGSVTLNGGGADTYAWSNGISNGIAFTLSSTTTYSVTGTDSNGCKSDTSITIVGYPLPIVNLGPDTIVVNLDLYQDTLITASGSSNVISFKWSTGATTDTIRVDSPGIYSVTVTSSDGCTSSDEVEVTFTTAVLDLSREYEICVSPNPTYDYISIICNGGSTSLAQILDNLGKVVSQDKTLISDGEKRTICLETLPSGMYYVRLSGDQFTMTVPVIKY